MTAPRSAPGVALAALVLLAGCRPPGPTAVATWRTYTSAEGRFAVLLPGTPILKHYAADAGKGEPERFAVTATNERDDAFRVDYQAKTRPDEEPGAILNRSRDGEVKYLAGAVLREARELTLDGFPGRQVVVDLPDPATPAGFTMVTRTFVVNRRIYWVRATVDRADRISPEVVRFLDSFRLLPR